MYTCECGGNFVKNGFNIHKNQTYMCNKCKVTHSEKVLQGDEKSIKSIPIKYATNINPNSNSNTGKVIEKEKYEESLKNEIQFNNANGTGSVSGNVLKPWSDDKPPPGPDPIEFCEQMGIDLKLWIIDRVKIRYWDVTLKITKWDGGKKTDEEAEKHRNYYMAVDLIKNFIDLKKLKDEILEDLKIDSVNWRPIIITPNMDSNHLLMFSLNDLHLGRYSWDQEVDKNYDHTIAYNNAMNSLGGILSNTSSFGIERILFILGNDLFNYDYSLPYPQTPAGTPVTADSRKPKLFRVAKRLIREIIDQLSARAKVDVLMIPGNHDPETMFTLGEVLEAIYDGNDNIHIDNRPKHRKYYRYGQNLIGTMHGNKEKVIDYHAIMASDQESKPLWSECKYAYFYCGHYHHEKTSHQKVSGKDDTRMRSEVSEDYKGVIVDWLPNLAHRDPYEFNAGFIGTIRSAKSAIHHKEKGRIATFNYNM